MTFALVQHAQATGASPGADTAAVTLAPTGAGNALIVAVSYATNAGGTDLTSVTLGGSGAGFAGAARKAGAAYPFFVVTYWVNYAIAAGQTALAVSAAGDGGFDLEADVFEVSGGLAALDVSAFQEVHATSTDWDSTATAETAAAAEFIAGMVAAYDNTGSAFTITGPGGDWENQAQQSINTQFSQLAGYQVAAATGTFDYAGTADVTGSDLSYLAGVATFRGAAAAPASSVIPAAMLTGML